MSAWVELTNGQFVNLDRIEGIVPVGHSTYRFNPPRAQRGGRPTGRPTERVPGYNEDRGYWEGIPVDEAGMLLYLRGGRGAVVHWEDAEPPQRAPQGVQDPEGLDDASRPDRPPAPSREA